MQSYVLKLIYTLFSVSYSMGLRLKCRGSDWKAFFLFLAPDPLLVIITLIRWWETMTSAFSIWVETKPQILRLSALRQRARWGSTVAFAAAISSFPVVCIGPVRKKTSNWEKQLAFPGETKNCHLVLISLQYSSQHGECCVHWRKLIKQCKCAHTEDLSCYWRMIVGLTHLEQRHF